MAYSINRRLILRCKRCKHDLRAPFSFCKKCGISQAFFIKKDFDGQSESVCATCNNAIYRTITPQSCTICRSPNIEWWDIKNEEWVPPHISINNELSGIWLIGDFSGDFIGDLNETNLPNDTRILENYARSYEVKITRGELSNYSFTQSPPELNLNPTSNPIRQKFSTNILVKDLNSNNYIPLKLLDLIVFDWHTVADKEFLDHRKIAGHLKGKLCACLVTEEVLDSVINEEKLIADQEKIFNVEKFQDTALQTNSTVNNSEVLDSVANKEKLTANQEDQRNVEDSKNAALQANSSINNSEVLNSDNKAISANFQKESENHKAINQSTDKSEHVPNTKNQSLKATENDSLDSANNQLETKCLVCNTYFQIILGICIFFWLKEDNIWKIFWCSLLQFIIFLSGIKLNCYLSKIIEKNGQQIKDFNTAKSFGNALLIIAIFSLLIIAGNIPEVSCYKFSLFDFWPLLTLICLLLSSFIRSCLTKLFLAVLFSLVILMTVKCDEKACKLNNKSFINQSSPTSQVENAKNKAKELVDQHQAKRIEDEVQDITSHDNKNRRVSIRDLEENTMAINKCMASIYLGELGLFDRNSSIIKKSGEDKLKLLSEWLKSSKSTNRYIITGHADQTGEILPDGSSDPVGYTRNMRLSKERAKAVGDWLISEGAIKSSQVIIRGVGSTEPLTTEPDKEMQKMNIRVEMKVDCENQDNKNG